MDQGPQIVEGVPLAEHTTLRVGGPARFYCRPATRHELTAAIAWARERDLPVLILGGGSNLLVADDGFPGLVVHLAMHAIDVELAGSHAHVRAGAGVVWDEFVARAVAQGYGGVECLSGIPGLVGATPIQNVGAYGQEVAETISTVDTIDLSTLTDVRFNGADCGFGYRDSRFKSADRGRYVVTAVSFTLAIDAKPAIRYRDLQQYFADRAGDPSLGAVRDAVLEIRRRKAMVLDAADTDTWSAGSFFVNPVVSSDVAARFPDDAPRFPSPTGVKLSAAWLIENSGFSKGYRQGNVGLSSRHALAIVNRGGATASEIVALARDIRSAVADRFGVTLAPEPVLVGLSL